MPRDGNSAMVHKKTRFESQTIVIKQRHSIGFLFIFAPKHSICRFLALPDSGIDAIRASVRNETIKLAA